jgi:hypothetical protein
VSASVERLVADAGRNWARQPGASDGDLARLVASAPWPVPDGLVDLLRYSNGGEGDLALAPGWFVLDSVDVIAGSFDDAHLEEQFDGFLFFGGNGGLERIALDCRGEAPFPVVMIDPIAGPGSAETVAPDIESFIAAIGLEHPER